MPFWGTTTVGGPTPNAAGRAGAAGKAGAGRAVPTKDIPDFGKAPKGGGAGAGKGVRTKDIPEFGKTPKGAGKAGASGGKAGAGKAGAAKAGAGKGAMRGAVTAGSYALAAKPLARNTRALARSVRDVDARGAATAGAKLGLTVATLKARWAIVAAIAAVLVLLLIVPVIGIAAVVGGTYMNSNIVSSLAAVGSQVETWSDAALAEIPVEIRQLYEEAVAQHCPLLSAMFVAAIGQVESNHGNDPLVRNGQANSAGARGVMQILPGTWAEPHRWDGNRDGVLDPNNAADSIHTGVRILCSYWGIVDPTKSKTSLWALAYAYNHGPYTSNPPRTEEVAVTECDGPGPHEVPGDRCYVKHVMEAYGRYVALPTGDAAALLLNPRVTISDPARRDLQSGYIDPRLISVLIAMAERFPFSIWGFYTGHGYFISGTCKVSNHVYGRAVDIGGIGGHPVSPSNQDAFAATAWFDTITGPLRPAEVGSPFPSFESRPGHFSNAEHLNHLHIGYSRPPGGGQVELIPPPARTSCPI